MKSLLLIFIIVFAGISQAQAETRWVSDKLFVPLRAGAGGNFKIVHKGLPSGTALTLLPENEGEGADGWTKVKTPGGLEGWIRSQYLEDEATAAIQLARLVGKSKKTEALFAQNREQINALKNENRELANTKASLEKSKAALEKELEQIKRVSGDAIRINQQHQQLLQETQMLKSEIEGLTAENVRLKENTQQTWFLYGILCFAAAILIVALLPHLRPKKRSSEWA